MFRWFEAGVIRVGNVPSIVRACDGVELFLPRGVPDHHAYVLADAVDPPGLLQEVHPYGLLVLVRVLPLAVPADHGRLTHAAVTQHHDLDLLLEVFLDEHGRRRVICAREFEPRFLGDDVLEARHFK